MVSKKMKKDFKKAVVIPYSDDTTEEELRRYAKRIRKETGMWVWYVVK